MVVGRLPFPDITIVVVQLELEGGDSEMVIDGVT